MHGDAGGLALLGDEPPAGAPFDDQLDRLAAELAQPLTQPDPVSRADPSADCLPAVAIHPIERDLSTMDVQSAYDRHHRTSSSSCYENLPHGGIFSLCGGGPAAYVIYETPGKVWTALPRGRLIPSRQGLRGVPASVCGGLLLGNRT
jgi:hypothetical protein